jgi:dipeptidyl aminopeptidase/acylaminoacyl peptidase
MYLVHTSVGHPTLEAWKYPLVGDEKIFQIQRVIVDATTGLVTRLRMPPDEHRSSLCDHVLCDGRFADVEWSRGGRQLAFVSTSRDHKRATLQVADAASGEVDDMIDERVYLFRGWRRSSERRFLPASDEAIWFSERDNWGHLYLYDLKTGRLKNRITAGDGNVSQTIRVDEQRRMVYFLGVGREKGRDPYFVHLYRISLDGQRQTLLTQKMRPDVSMSPSGRYFVDSYSKPDSPPVAVLRDSTR